MLKRMSIQNLTLFPHADLQFAAGLNVIVGENGSGKTHLLKAAYSVIAASVETGKLEKGKKPGTKPSAGAMQRAYADKLTSVFRAEKLGRLARRRQGAGNCELEFEFAPPSALDCHFSFSTRSDRDVRIIRHGDGWQEKAPVFFPSREMLTLHPFEFLSVYEQYPFNFDQTYRDLCRMLIDPALRGPRPEEAWRFLQPLEESMGGKILCDKATKRFYLRSHGNEDSQGSNVEAPLLAEGMNKIAMIAHLIANGALFGKGYLFWDEPEANLNPRLIKVAARVICMLCASGMQVFVGTHSLFLLKELETLYYEEEFHHIARKYFALSVADRSASASDSKRLTDLPALIVLEEELDQSGRYMRVKMEAKQ